MLDFQRNAGLPPDGIVGDEHPAQAGRAAQGRVGARGQEDPRPRTAASWPRAAWWAPWWSSTPVTAARTAAWSRPRRHPEKDVTLALGLRLAELLRAEGCRVRLTRERDETVPLYVRADAVETAAADYLLSLHCNGDPSRGRHRRRRLLLPAQPLLLGARRAASRTTSGPSVGAPRRGGFVGSVGRNYAMLREPTAIAVHGRAALPDQRARRRARRAAPTTSSARHAPSSWASRATWRAPEAGRSWPSPPSHRRRPRGVTVPDPAPATAFTATQRQRLHELGAAAAATGRTLRRAPRRATRPSAASRPSSPAAGRAALEALRGGAARAGRCVVWKRRCAARSRGAGLVEVVTPAIIGAEALRKMGVEHGQRDERAGVLARRRALPAAHARAQPLHRDAPPLAAPGDSPSPSTRSAPAFAATPRAPST